MFTQEKNVLPVYKMGKIYHGGLITICFVSLALWIFSRVFTHVFDTNMLV